MFFLSLRRSPIAEDSARENHIRCQTIAHGLLERATGAPPSGFRQQPVPERGRQTHPGDQAGAQRIADQDLVSEQASEAEEVERTAERSGTEADGRGTVQSHECSHELKQTLMCYHEGDMCLQVYCDSTKRRTTIAIVRRPCNRKTRKCGATWRATDVELHVARTQRKTTAHYACVWCVR